MSRLNTLSYWVEKNFLDAREEIKCDFCGEPADAYWKGQKEIFVCANCATDRLVDLVVDALLNDSRLIHSDEGPDRPFSSEDQERIKKFKDLLGIMIEQEFEELIKGVVHKDEDFDDFLEDMEKRIEDEE